MFYDFYMKIEAALAVRYALVRCGVTTTLARRNFSAAVTMVLNIRRETRGNS